MIWTEKQVENLKKRQNNRSFHPYTCSCHSKDLIPTVDGWKCPISEEIVQDWAFLEDLVGKNNVPTDEFNRIIMGFNKRD